MQIINIQFAPWDKPCEVVNKNNISLTLGDYVVLATDTGKDIGRVIDIYEKVISDDQSLGSVVKIATTQDMLRLPDAREKDEIIGYCRMLVKHHGLNMKIIDVHTSCDFSRMKFAFVADGRIDFRDLVKDLTRHFKQSIILYQIGIRDEAKMYGDVGRCGCRQLCCGKFLKEIGGITSEMADTQQISHRGNERLNGQCGRLMCCLKYEQGGYAALAKQLPPLGSVASYENMRAEVIGWHTLKKTVDLKVYDNKNNCEKIFDVPLDKIKLVK